MADRVLVQGNLFDGAGQPNAGGVRIAGADHVVVENTFRDLRAPVNLYTSALSLMSASAESAAEDPVGYGRARNVLVAQNRFERTDSRIAVGIYPRPEYPLLPLGLLVLDNVFTGTTATSPFDFVAPDPTGALAGSIRESGNRFEAPAPDAVSLPR